MNRRSNFLNYALIPVIDSFPLDFSVSSDWPVRPRVFHVMLNVCCAYNAPLAIVCNVERRA